MNMLARFRSNRTLVFGVVATLALLVSVVLAFDFRLAEIVDFLWQCLLLIVAMMTASQAPASSIARCESNAATVGCDDRVFSSCAESVSQMAASVAPLTSPSRRLLA